MTNDNLVQRLRDSAQLSSLPQWVRDEFTQAADRIDYLEALLEDVQYEKIGC
jgi:hypothetical protein